MATSPPASPAFNAPIAPIPQSLDLLASALNPKTQAPIFLAQNHQVNVPLPLFFRLRSGHRLFQRALSPKQIPSNNAAILEVILSGKDTGPKRDIVLLNTAAALADHMGDAIGIAREAITSGAAIERLRLLQKASAS